MGFAKSETSSSLCAQDSPRAALNSLSDSVLQGCLFLFKYQQQRGRGKQNKIFIFDFVFLPWAVVSSLPPLSLLSMLDGSIFQEEEKIKIDDQRQVELPKGTQNPSAFLFEFFQGCLLCVELFPSPEMYYSLSTWLFERNIVNRTFCDDGNVLLSVQQSRGTRG